MKELLLRDVLKEAQKKNAEGLLIWPSWGTWDNLKSQLIPGNPKYDFALSEIAKDNISTIDAEFLGLKIPDILAVPTQKLLESEDAFKEIVSICETKFYDGPISLLPANELSNHF